MESIFKGCHIVFLHRQHIARMRQKVLDCGGDVQAAADARTTHLIVGTSQSAESGIASLKRSGLLRYGRWKRAWEIVRNC